VHSEFTVRQLARDDAFVPAYRSLRIQLWPDCDDCDREIATILANPASWTAFILLQGGHTAAGFIEVHLREYAEGSSNSPVAFIEGWFVVPEQRRQGLGRVLVKAAEDWAVSKGCNELGSDTEASNNLSIQVHKQLGFQEVERLVCFLKPI
jgi:aminoglycoside 6'-N-acetyltransferase I